MKLLISQEELQILKSRAEIPLECGFCKNIFYLTKNQVLAGLNGQEKSRGSFCSKQCSNKDNSRQHRTIIECCQCHKAKEIRLSDRKEKNFCSRKCSAVYHGNIFRKPKELRPPKTPKIKEYLNLNCSFCHMQIKRTPADFKNSKTKTFFCCKSHKTQYANQYQIIHKPKSRAETLLCNLIKENFPNLTIRENARDILPSKLEIDILIPEHKLAIELNGPVHYIPMYGQEKLDKVKNKDLIKQSEIQQLGLNLIIIDISQLNSRQSTDLFIKEYFEKYIKPILQSKMVE